MAAPQANFIEKINYIIASFMDPCDAPFTIYAETFLPAFIEAFVELYSFDPMEIKHQQFRSTNAPLRQRSGRKGGRGSKAGRGRFRKYAGRVLGFDPNEMVGNEMGKWQKYTPALTWGKRFLWILDGLLQRAVFYWFLAELFLEAFYKWMTLVNKSEYCQAQSQTLLLAHGDPQTIAAISGWSPVLFNHIDKIRGDIQFQPAAGSFDADQGVLMSKVTMTSVFFGPPTTHKMEMRVGIVRNGNVSYPYYDTITLPTGSTWAFEGGCSLKQGDQFFVETRINPGFGDLSGKEIYVQGLQDAL